MRYIAIFVSLFLVFSSVAFALEIGDSIEDPNSFLVDLLESLGSGSVGSSSVSAEPSVVNVQVLSTLDPVTPSKSNGFKSVILSVLGDYNSIVTEYQYQNTNGTYSYVREITPDYPWLVSSAIFGIFLYCVMRMGGALLCRL